MSTFKVYKNDNEVAGSIIAATEFNAMYTEAINATTLFKNWIRKLINIGGGVKVTYGDSDLQVYLDGNKFYVTDENGVRHDLILKGDNDDKNTKKVMMIKPGQKPELDDPYLSNIVTNINTEPSQADAMAYLLGTILLRRCR
ncbi:hypothetical protein IB238_10520 [Rhizobium sp. ARZ01]|uniref:hypothetical protein n=1 Tax=Rhizobium sp. ARZ01 TaxID=2769313 RepID=UPI00178418D2|nr:hypothetical protein [Rhizobium sp. ARZ01]MBD9373053.1 hypothetical protein [Rhizobium sp. ARZ01]